MKSIATAILFGVAISASSQTIVDSVELLDQLVIYYEVDEHMLNEKNRTIIDKFIESQDSAHYEYHIDAHTDSDGSNEYNYALSKRRHDEILTHLEKFNISTNDILAKYHGEEKLLEEGSAKSAKAKNRRATIIRFQHVPYILFQGFLQDKDSLHRLNGEAQVIFDNYNLELAIDSTTNFSIPIPLEKRVEMHFSSDGYFPEVRKVKLSKRSKTDNVNIDLVRLKLNASLRTTIQFFGGQSKILEESKPEVKTLLSTLLANSDICVELQGHINQPNANIVSVSSVSHGLSVARSLRVYQEMLAGGVDSTRLIARGYGNSQMVYPKARTGEEEQSNRRVEVKVMSCDSTAIIKNDVIFNVADTYPKGVLDHPMNPKKLNVDIAKLSKPNQRIIVNKLKELKAENIPPAKYTYRQVLRAYYASFVK